MGRPLQFVRPKEDGAIDHLDVGDLQGAELRQCMSPSQCGGKIMIADQEQTGDAGAGQAHDPGFPLPLESRRRVAVFICVAGEDDQVHLLLNRCSDNDIQRFEKIHHPDRQPGLRVVTSMVGDINMCVGEVQEFNHRYQVPCLLLQVAFLKHTR